ncbi:hypothetical protein Dvina_27140 [Dactylosporangium vinaceum]|uniref:Mycothiol-dependent maleylpyruvate isomerase metal-binding domain-containing protein n=1 Tax=Dactylosporangium vinaceum TaxID=53362 RepID=A0ABV5MC53_9ACTN|nr:hypothetical protein [Dactylosporangium vinaceum]UAB92070.1 hypothetical protein Dvina_27140 [Dactylosporangium vinaceum]
MPIAQAVAVVASLEVRVHTWDLTRATGGAEALDSVPVAQVHAAAEPYAAGRRP